MLFMLASLLVTATASLNAHAQDVDTFSFSGSMYDRQGTLQLAHPHLGQEGGYYAGLGLTLADDPLVLYYAESDREETLVATQFSTRLAAGYTLGRRARIDLDVPVYPSVKVEDAATFAMGNIRLGATIPLLDYDEEGEGLAVAAIPFLDLPTGSQEAYLSSGGMGGGLIASVGGQRGVFGWAANAGLNLARPQALDETLTMGSNLVLGGGMHVDLTPEFLLGAEGTSHVDFANGFKPWNKQSIEAHLYASHIGETGLVVTLGGGTGLLAGVGAPDYRLVLALAYHSPIGPDDTDGDGITDDLDQCPTEPEDKDNFEDADGCPDVDNDKDGILDVDDQCPNDPEDKDSFEDNDGCPDKDNDKDGILDGDDQCPNDPGPVRTQGCPDRDNDTVIDKQDQCPDDPGPVATQGCPDADSDLVPDFRDKCPNDPIPRDADPAHSDGCPAIVYVAHEQIVILEKVYFDVNKSTIKPVSHKLLNQVADIINKNPQIKLIEVAGHTDSDADDNYNLKLSQARVEAVVKFLTTYGGVDASRLVAVGYGETKPIDTNDTKEGKAMNRRVEFNILKQE